MKSNLIICLLLSLLAGAGCQHTAEEQLLTVESQNRLLVTIEEGGKTIRTLQENPAQGAYSEVR